MFDLILEIVRALLSIPSKWSPWKQWLAFITLIFLLGLICYAALVS